MSFLKKKSKNKNEAIENLPLVAIDMGSDRIRAIAAEPIGDGKFRVLGAESIFYEQQCIARGVITRPSDMAFSIKRVLALLGNRIGLSSLPLALISWGGCGVKVTDATVHRQMQNRSVTQKDIDDWHAECRDKTGASSDVVLELIPHRFVLDGGAPVFGEPEIGLHCKDLRVMYNTFYGPREMTEQVKASFENTKSVRIENACVRSEALLSAFAATDGDTILDEGCAVLDFGAETTTLFIYKGTHYFLHRVFEQGGADITDHLATHFNIPFSAAEQLKREYGVASPDFIEQNCTLTINYTDGSRRQITYTDVAQQIEVVLKVLLAPIFKILSPYEPNIARLYITGGGSMLRGLARYLQLSTAMHVLYGSHQNVLAPDTDEAYYTPTYSSLVGMLILGQDKRDSQGSQAGQPLDKKNKWFNNVGKTVSDTVFDIFGGADL